MIDLEQHKQDIHISNQQENFAIRKAQQVRSDNPRNRVNTKNHHDEIKNSRMILARNEKETAATKRAEVFIKRSHKTLFGR